MQRYFFRGRIADRGDVTLFSCMSIFITGIVIAAANLFF